MADDDYSDFQPNPEADVAQLEGSDYSGFIQEPSASSGSIRMASEWVPGEPRTHATQYGPDERPLVFGASAAVSPNLSQGHPLHEKFEVYRGGRSLGQYSYDDASYYSPGRPTTNTIERYGLPDIGRADSIKWLGKSSPDDYSGFIADNSGTSAPSDDYSGFKPVEQQAPQTEQQAPRNGTPGPQEQNPWDIGKAWQNLFGTATQAGAGLDIAKAREDLNIAKSGQPKATLFGTQEEEDQKALVNPNISQADAEEIIARRRSQTDMDQEIAQRQLTHAQSEQDKAALATPGPEYQRTIPGTITRFLGQAAPYLMSGTLGPAGPMAMAGQMSEQGYGEAYDRSIEAARKAHPDWTQDQISAAAHKAGMESAQTGFENGVVIGLLPVPKVGPLIARMVEQVGLRGTYMAIAGASQDIEQNLAIQKNVDPRQAIYDGVLAHAPANFVAGAAFGIPEAIGEAFAGRGIPEARPEQQQPEQSGRQEQPSQEQRPGQVAMPVEENGETAEERQTEVQPEQPIEQPQPEPQQNQTEPESESETAEMYSGISPKAILKAAEPIEHLYLPNREVVAKQPHTEELISALDEFRAKEGELQGQVAQLNHLFKTLKRQNPNLDKEIDQIGRYAEQNRALPAQMSPQAQTWLKQANNGLYRQIGDRMRAGGFRVVNPDGSTRAFIGAPPDVTPMPRVMRPDVDRILQGSLLDNTGNFTPEAQKLYQEGVNAGYFQKPEDLIKWARQYRMDHSEKPNITNLERARTSKYPSFFYTYSPQAMLDRLFWQSSELARLESFGQKLPGQSDLFDKTADKINADMTLGNNRKQPAFNAIEALRRTVYGQNKRSWGIRLLRGASSAGLAGSPHTSAKIGLSMLFNIPQYRGLGRTLTGILDAAVHPGKTYAELRRLGLSQETLINIHDDPYSVQTAERRASNIFTGILRIAGHSLVQDIGKAVTMRVSKSWIERASQILQRDPQMKSSLTRQVAEDIRRRGVDPTQFANGNVSQALKDRFVREDVNDLQTAYRPEDYPSWQASGMGSVMFQFGHWAYNGARAITREAIMPMVRAYNGRDYMLASRYFGRVVGLSLAAGGAAEAWRELDQLFGRQPAVATIGEIMKAFTRNNPEAAHMLTARLIEDILTSPVLGTFGDIANLGRNVTKGAAGETHFFNPASPAAVGYLSIIGNAVNMAFQQGGHLSMRQIANISSQLASLGKGYYDIANSLGGAASQVTGAKPNEIPIPGHGEAMGRRENLFVKSRLDVFYSMHPELDKRQKGGTFAGNTHTPYLQDLNEELLAGNGVEARRIAFAMKKDLGLTDKQWTTSLSESINGHRPIPTGTAGDAFMRWAPRSLTPDEFARMRRIERVYETTAQRAGLPVKQE